LQRAPSQHDYGTCPTFLFINGWVVRKKGCSVCVSVGEKRVQEVIIIYEKGKKKGKKKKEEKEKEGVIILYSSIEYFFPLPSVFCFFFEHENVVCEWDCCLFFFPHFHFYYFYLTEIPFVLESREKLACSRQALVICTVPEVKK
jgi:hypothetical protein